MEDTSSTRAVLVGVAIGLTVLFGSLMVPRATWAPPLIKIGVVNWEQTVMRYEALQSELEELQRRRERILTFIEEEYGKLKRRQIEGQEGRPRDPELKKLYEDAFQQVQKQRQDTIKKYQRRIREAIRQEAIEQGYSLILSENEVLYAADSYTDLTRAVIERLNEGSTSTANASNGNT